MPESEDDLRPISLTTFFSKVMEQFVVQWLIEIIGHKLDFRQYGGMKGNAVSHYLIELINFILFNQDSKEPTSVLACLVDFSKAFNRQDHTILVTKLSDLGVPSWLLKIIISFLSDRTMVVKYKGETSSVKQLPGGGPQGALLGMFLFLVLVNDVGFTDQKNESGEIITCKKRIKEFNELHLKYVDDLTLAEAIPMKSLNFVPVDRRPQPDNYHARTGHEINPEQSRVFKSLKETKDYAIKHKMKTNYKKTKLMLFNPGTSRDFMPRINLGNEEELELVEEIKLLGVVVRSDLSWSSHTKYMVGNAIASCVA